jgi:hypothetical protein
LACQEGGFQIFRNRIDNRNKNIKKVEFKCTRGRISEKHSKATSRPQLKEHLCPFLISVFFHKEYKRWFMPKKGSGSLIHIGHCKVDSDTLDQRTTYLDAAEMKLCLDTLTENVPIPCLQKILKTNKNVSLSNDQIKFLKKATLSKNGGETTTAADKLIAQVESDPNVVYQMITADVESGSNLVTIRKTKKALSRAKSTSKVSAFSPKAVSDPESIETFAKIVLDALKIKSGQKILLCLSWTTKAGILYFRKYPERIGVDVTNGTNTEKRPLFRGTIISSNHRNIPVWNAFLPSQAQWVFKWLFQEAFPALFPLEARERVRLVMTDEDPQCFTNITAAIDARIIPNAHLRFCKWHKVNRNFVLKSGKITETEKLIQETISQWLYSFVDSIESEEESKVSRSLMVQWLDSCGDNISPKFREHIDTYWIKSFWPKLQWLQHSFFMNVKGGDLRLNSFQECEFFCLKHDTSGPKPCHSLAAAQSRVQKHEERRYAKLKKENSKSMTKIKGIDKNPVYAGLSSRLVPHALTLLWGQYNERTNYKFISSTLNVFLVRRFIWKTKTKHGEIARIDRTRTVMYIDQKLICGCGYFQRNGKACRHIYSLLSSPPELNHVRSEFLKVYDGWYGVNDEFTTMCNDEVEVEGPHVDRETFNLDEKRRSSDMDWFLEALPNKPPIIVPSEGRKCFQGSNTNKSFASPSTSYDGRLSSVSESFSPPFGRNPYTSLLPVVTQISTFISSQEDYYIAHTAMNEVLKQLMQRRNERASTPTQATQSSQDTSVATFPSIDKRGKDTRKKPFNSPSNFKKA